MVPDDRSRSSELSAELTVENLVVEERRPATAIIHGMSTVARWREEVVNGSIFPSVIVAINSSTAMDLGIYSGSRAFRPAHVRRAAKLLINVVYSVVPASSRGK